jgi:toxin-antitoxin system, toxin component, bro family
MNLCTLSNGAVIPIQEWEGRRVVTYADIANAHKIDKNRVAKAFLRHKAELFENKDYYVLNKKEALKFKGFTDETALPVSARGLNALNLFTESGYLMIACTLRGDEAAMIRRGLVNSYFRMKEIESPKIESTEGLSMFVSTLKKLTNSIDRISSLVEQLVKDKPEKKPNVKQETRKRENDISLEELARKYRWFQDKSGEPHVYFAEEICKLAGVRFLAKGNTIYTKQVKDKDIGEIVKCLTPQGILAVEAWCKNNDFGRCFYAPLRYQKDGDGYRAGDIRQQRYVIPNMSGTKKFYLRKF